MVDTSPSALFLAAGDYHHHVGLNAWNGRSAPVDAGACGLAWFELVVPTGDTLGARRRRLDAEEVPVIASGDGVFEATDPDGIGIRVRTGAPDDRGDGQ